MFIYSLIRNNKVNKITNNIRIMIVVDSPVALLGVGESFGESFGEKGLPEQG